MDANSAQKSLAHLSEEEAMAMLKTGEEFYSPEAQKNLAACIPSEANKQKVTQTAKQKDSAKLKDLAGDVAPVQ